MKIQLRLTPEQEAFGRAFGLALRRARQRAELSQEAAAATLNRTRQHLTAMESGKANVSLCPVELALLADLYGTQPEEFFLIARDLVREDQEEEERQRQRGAALAWRSR